MWTTGYRINLSLQKKPVGLQTANVTRRQPDISSLVLKNNEPKDLSPVSLGAVVDGGC
jgi:hypothetical protein